MSFIYISLVVFFSVLTVITFQYESDEKVEIELKVIVIIVFVTCGIFFGYKTGTEWVFLKFKNENKESKEFYVLYFEEKQILIIDPDYISNNTITVKDKVYSGFTGYKKINIREAFEIK